MNEQVTQFLEGEGDGEGDVDEQRGQGAEGQGDGDGGDAVLGEDQSPTTQRKRGLMLQPIVELRMLMRKFLSPLSVTEEPEARALLWVPIFLMLSPLVVASLCPLCSPGC